MKRAIALAVVSLALASCQSPQQTSQSPQAQQSSIQAGAPYQLSAAETEAVREGIRSQLKDPTSPIYGPMVASKTPSGTVTVCGYVNAKNSFGGYTGDQRFLGGIIGTTPKLGFYVIEFGSTDSKNYAVTEVCRQSGITI